MRRVRKAVVIAAVFALGIVVEAHIRRTPSDGYGRLFGQEVAVRNDDVQPRKIEVVNEAPVQPAPRNDAVLTAPSASDTQAVPQTAAAPVAQAAAAPDAAPQTFRPSHSRFTIVGDENGVSVVTNNRR
jgi:hypothetical protein